MFKFNLNKLNHTLREFRDVKANSVPGRGFE